MDPKIIEQLTESIEAVESRLESMSNLQSLNENLELANGELAKGAQSLHAAASEFPEVNSLFKELASRLEELAKILEGSDLAVLVTKVESFGDLFTEINKQMGVFDQNNLHRIQSIERNQAEKLEEVVEQLSGIIVVLKQEFATSKEQQETGFSKLQRDITFLKILISIIASVGFLGLLAVGYYAF